MATTLDRPAVPTVSLAQEASDPVGFAAALGGSFERYGFAIVSDHGVPAEVIAEAEAKAKAFFALPEEVKRRYHMPGTGGARGYTPFGIETAKDAKAHDLKEFWHVGRELPSGHRFTDLMSPNLWPDEVAGFRAAELALFDALDAAGRRLLAAIARYLTLSPDFFDDTVADGNSVLRLLHYPAMGMDGPSIRAGAHEDINTITLLLGAEEAGLELLDRDGNWLPVQPRAGELAVNVGDMLQRLTNNVLRSTTHRVMNPAPERRGHARYSMPFFLHFRPDYLIETLPGCLSAERPNLYPEPITAHDYLLQRLREIKLI
ncbi:isopenicillin N synthase family dioxygenase [Sphingomonas nostoxanthinifaciens]|uniref:isopenicillin N synthase family dioxygenase n=1 Tax=Sphingomonas nostoxanthinifaciens TaxID=2872652 RepID=UPI001CC2109B|nr:2-oxoglutarate and iron-dependent oxygenase domain-containing protein [Sphingomonas nostoxanthinifaciens]UAK25998.1 isopenicillin N synthase family oxygenase [Sphingomonas nostoxanthinifaciens]